MGVLTLTNFRDDLQQALGNRGLGNTFLDRQINYAYHDVCGMVDFEELEEEAAAQTVVSQNYVSVPSGAWLIKLVRNTTDDTRLDWVPKTEFWRRAQTAGVPIRWTRQQSLILLNPVPNIQKTLKIVFKKWPSTLAAVGDTTVLPPTWDAAVALLAGHFALMNLGEEARAGAWFQRAMTFIQSRMTEGEIKESLAGVGLTLPFVGQRLAAMQAATQQGG